MKTTMKVYYGNGGVKGIGKIGKGLEVHPVGLRKGSVYMGRGGYISPRKVLASAGIVSGGVSRVMGGETARPKVVDAVKAVRSETAKGSIKPVGKAETAEKMEEKPVEAVEVKIQEKTVAVVKEEKVEQTVGVPAEAPRATEVETAETAARVEENMGMTAAEKRLAEYLEVAQEMKVAADEKGSREETSVGGETEAKRVEVSEAESGTNEVREEAAAEERKVEEASLGLVFGETKGLGMSAAAAAFVGRKKKRRRRR